MAELDLWPQDLVPEAEVVSPKTILQQQANLLSEKTRNKLLGRVETKAAEGGFLDKTTGKFIDPDFRHTLQVRVPALEYYEYDLLSVFANATSLYPIWAIEGREAKALGDEAAFNDWLKAYFSSKKTRDTIASLLAQAA